MKRLEFRTVVKQQLIQAIKLTDDVKVVIKSNLDIYYIILIYQRIMLHEGPNRPHEFNEFMQNKFCNWTSVLI